MYNKLTKYFKYELKDSLFFIFQNFSYLLIISNIFFLPIRETPIFLNFPSCC